MNDYPLEPGQRMIVKPNAFGQYTKYAHYVVCLGTVISTENGIIAKDCSYVDDEHRVHMLDIPLFLLWRIADDEDLLEIHENYMHSKNLSQLNVETKIY